MLGKPIDLSCRGARSRPSVWSVTWSDHPANEEEFSMTSRAVRTFVAAVCAAAAMAGCSTADTAAPASSAEYADIAKSPACAKLRQDHPDLGGKTMRNAINPYTPGYETVDPNDPGKYQGFDIDLGNAM